MIRLTSENLQNMLLRAGFSMADLRLAETVIRLRPGNQKSTLKPRQPVRVGKTPEAYSVDFEKQTNKLWPDSKWLGIRTEPRRSSPLTGFGR